MTDPFRIAFVPGVTPDKWARIWRERHPEWPLQLAPVEESQQRVVLVDGSADMVLARLPIERDGLHLIPLYEEQPVVVVGKEHPVAAYDEIPVADLAAEQLVAGEVPGWDEITSVPRLPFPEMTTKEAFEVVASGTGMAVVPLSVARLHHRKDLVHRPVLDVPTTRVGLAWLVDNDDERVETFIGIVRGRRATSSRGTNHSTPAPKAAGKSRTGKPGGPDAGKGGRSRSRSRQSTPPRKRRR